MVHVTTISPLSELRGAISAENIDLIANRADGKGAKILSELSDMARSIGAGQAAEGMTIDFVSGLAEVIAKPQSINQGDAITCTQTGVLWDQAVNHTMDLVHLGKSLVKNGQTKMADGTVLKLDQSDFLRDDPKKTEPFQARNAFESTYQNLLFRPYSTVLEVPGPDGHMHSERTPTINTTKKMLQAITGQPTIGVGDVNDMKPIFHQVETLIRQKRVEEATQLLAGKHVGMQWMDNGKDMYHHGVIHSFGVDKDGPYVNVFQGWGKINFKAGPDGEWSEATGLKKMSLKDFENRCLCLYLQKNDPLVSQYSLKDSVDRVPGVSLTSEGPLPVSPDSMRAMMISAQEMAIIDDQNRKSNEDRDNFLKKMRSGS